MKKLKFSQWCENALKKGTTQSQVEDKQEATN
jgi:hypothetical protein